jgi:hypothetical protein
LMPPRPSATGTVFGPMVSHPRCGLPAAALTRIAARGPSASSLSEGNIPEIIEDACLSIGSQPFRDRRMEKTAHTRHYRTFI